MLEYLMKFQPVCPIRTLDYKYVLVPWQRQHLLGEGSSALATVVVGVLEVSARATRSSWRQLLGLDLQFL